MEAEPVRFLARELDGHLAASRAALGGFVGADPDDLAFVTNATGAVNAVVRSLSFEPGDEILTTDHEYNAILNVLRHVAERDGARVVVARLPFPGRSADDVVERVLAAATARTRLAVISHVTSPTALVLPVERLVPALARAGDRHARRRRSRPGHAAARPGPARRRLVRGQSPQVGLRAQGCGLPARPARSAAGCPSRARSPTAPIPRSAPGRASGSSSTGRGRSTRPPGCRCRPP